MSAITRISCGAALGSPNLPSCKFSFRRFLRIWFYPSCGCNPCAQNTPDCDDGYAG
jgi:hypothetical protein